jgi:hypothetical protein
MSSTGLVSPAALLAQVKQEKSIAGLSDSLLGRIDNLTGTPDAKLRIGVITAFDPVTWRASAQVGGATVVTPNVETLSGFWPVVGQTVLLVQSGPEYVVLAPVGPDEGETYTPTWKTGPGGTDILINNGTLTGQFWRRGRLIFFRIILIRGSTTNYGGANYYALGLPVPSVTSYIGGHCHIIDASASAALPHQWMGINNTEIFIANAQTSRKVDNVGFGSAGTAWSLSGGPHDSFGLEGWYEALV